MRNNSKARRAQRKAAADERLRNSKPCVCGSVHIGGHKGGAR